MAQRAPPAGPRGPAGPGGIVDPATRRSGEGRLVIRPMSSAGAGLDSWNAQEMTAAGGGWPARPRRGFAQNVPARPAQTTPWPRPAVEASGPARASTIGKRLPAHFAPAGRPSLYGAIALVYTPAVATQSAVRTSAARPGPYPTRNVLLAGRQLTHPVLEPPRLTDDAPPDIQSLGWTRALGSHRTPPRPPCGSAVFQAQLTFPTRGGPIL